jgi:hypothetical protein
MSVPVTEPLWDSSCTAWPLKARAFTSPDRETRFTALANPETVMSPLSVATRTCNVGGTCRSHRTRQTTPTGMAQSPSLMRNVSPSMRSSTTGRRNP